MRLIFGIESHSCAIHNFRFFHKNPEDSHDMPGGFLSDVNPVSNYPSIILHLIKVVFIFHRTLF